MTPRGQLSLFDKPSLSSTKRKPEIDLRRIEAELQADAQGVAIKVRRGHNDDCRVRCEETDKGVTVRINPKRIRTQAQLDEVIASCQDSINWPLKC